MNKELLKQLAQSYYYNDNNMLKRFIEDLKKDGEITEREYKTAVKYWELCLIRDIVKGKERNKTKCTCYHGRHDAAPSSCYDCEYNTGCKYNVFAICPCDCSGGAYPVDTTAQGIIDFYTGKSKPVYKYQDPFSGEALEIDYKKVYLNIYYRYDFRDKTRRAEKLGLDFII